MLSAVVGYTSDGVVCSSGSKSSSQTPHRVFPDSTLKYRDIVPQYSTMSFSSSFRFSISLVGPLSPLSPRLHLVPSKLFSSRHVPPSCSFTFFLFLPPLCSTLSDYCGHTGNIRGEKHPLFRLLVPLTLCPPGIDPTFRSLPICIICCDVRISCADTFERDRLNRITNIALV